MPSKSKQSAKQTVIVEEKGAPSPETLAAIPAKKARGAKPSMIKNEQAEQALSIEAQYALSDTRTKAQIVSDDVNIAVSAVDEMQSKIQAGRFGPKGTWTTLVAKFVFNSKDWSEVQSLFKATLVSTLRHRAEQENPIASFPGMSEQVYKDMIGELVEQQTKRGSYQTILSEFNIIGRAFKTDKQKRLVGCGRDKLLAVLMGKEDSKGNKLAAPLPAKRVLEEARETVGKDTRGRTKGSTNKNPTGPADTPEKDKPETSTMEVIHDKDKASRMAREAGVRNIRAYLDSLPNDAELLLPIVHALGNKLKASNHKDAVDLGLLMVDLVIGAVPAEETKTA